MPSKIKDIQLNKIGLCLPGGGFRAAAFSLGILKFLHDVSLLSHLKGISTVSGGTITGAKYVESYCKGIPFEEFYDEMYSWLAKNKLASDALNMLKDKKQWKDYPYKRLNLINAFAIQYQKFIPCTLGDVEKKLNENNLNDKGLVRAIFNATDFTNGLEFRFQNLDKGQRKFGNLYQHDNYKDTRHELQLGDIVAASSCFPGGFEPISFPHDFGASQDTFIKDAPPVGLMDGGIIDNIGISSFLTGNIEYDFYLLGDVGSEKLEDPFVFTDHHKTAKFISGLYNVWLFIAVLAFAAFSIYKEIDYVKEIMIAVATLFLTIHASLAIALWYAKSQINYKGMLWLQPGKVGVYILDRIRSLVLMNTTIFLKSAKSRNISNVYKLTNNKAAKISIYDLHVAASQDIQTALGKVHLRYLAKIPQRLVDKSKAVSAFPTTLWFEEESKGDILPDLVQVGRASTCYNLIKYLLTVENESEISEDPFFEKLLIYWEEIVKEESLSE
jgi:predicted acylesterase/phospholipase RssA